MAVFVLAQRKKPWRPCSEKRARGLLERGRAGASDSAVPYPAGGSVAGRFRAKAPAAETGPRQQDHRGPAIREALTQRLGHRRGCRLRFRYRLARFN